MDAIKKKMQAMKLEKDNAMDRADACEQQAKDANLRAERVGRRINYLLLLLLLLLNIMRIVQFYYYRFKLVIMNILR